MTRERAFWRVKDLAPYLSLSEWEVRRLKEAGILHARYIGESQRFYRITDESVQSYIASLAEEPVA